MDVSALCLFAQFHVFPLRRSPPNDDNKTKFREVIFKREILIENNVSHNASTSVSVLLIFIYK